MAMKSLSEQKTIFYVVAERPKETPDTSSKKACAAKLVIHSENGY
jgi:hypothetical protein